MTAPAVSARLEVRGLVAHPGWLSADDLRALPAEQQIADMTALDPKRRGQAVTLAGLVARVQPAPDARWLTLHASADDFHASVPLDEVLARGLLIHSLDGQPLPAAQGGPIRFYVRDFAACHSADVDECANVKFVDCLEFTRERGHDNRPADERAHAALHRATHGQ